MEINLLAPMVAAIVSIIALCVTNIVSIIENKKSRHISVVTNQTIEHKERVFKNAAEILALTHPLLVDEPCENDLLRLKKRLLIACSEFELRIRPVYPETLEQITAMRCLVKSFFHCLKLQYGNTENIKELSEAHTKFRELMSSFDSANWHYIKLQSDGKKWKPGKFAQLYKDGRIDFDKVINKPKEWVDDNIL